MKKYEFKKLYEKFEISEETLNAYGEDGWSIGCCLNGTIILQREIIPELVSYDSYDDSSY